MTPVYSQETCKACGGSGIQTRNDGIRIKCPVCGGTGIQWVSNMDNLPPGVYCCTK